VAKVKRYESGVLRDPVVITPEHTVLQVMQLSDSWHLGFPVSTAARWSASSPAATCASRPATTCRCAIMTPRERLITVPEGTSLPRPRRC
jgi:IMP dehydrogenase